MRLPWGFYIDVLTLIGTGAGIMLGVLLQSVPMISYHAAIGLVITWHLAALVKKFANSKENIGDENDECK